MDKLLLVIIISVFAFDILQLLLANRLWLWEFTTFIPWYVIFAVHIVLLIAVAFTQQWWAVLVLFGVLVLQFRMVDLGFGTTKPDSDPNQISVFSWNTEFWEPDSSEAELYAHIFANQADIIHLQEAMEVNGVAKPVEDKIQTLLGKDYKVIQYGELVSATKLPIKEVIASDKGAFQRLDLEVNGQIISAYNVHIPVHVIPSLIKEPVQMLDYVRTRFYRRQEASAALIADLEQNPNPKIITGDFNTQTSMPLIYYYLDNFREAARDSSFGIPTSIRIGGAKLWRIDYVFGDKVQFAEYQEVDPLKLSDHSGQKARFTITN